VQTFERRQVSLPAVLFYLRFGFCLHGMQIAASSPPQAKLYCRLVFTVYSVKMLIHAKYIGSVVKTG
jgi:hypothetical protein